MDATTARQEADKILAGLPDRISDVIKPFARRSPDHPALVQDDVTWSYGDLAAIVARTAITLADYGVRPGDRVMIVSENSLALAAILLAASEIDAWPVVVNPRLSEREIDLIRDHSGARRVFYTIEVSDNARQHAGQHGAAIVALPALGTLGIGALNEQTASEPVETDRARQVAALLYTSGTTGNPKGVMLTHRNVLFSARIVGSQRGVTPADKAYCVLPMSHIVGYSAILIASLMFGCTVQIVPRYDPAALISAIADEGITLLFGVPATYQRLLEHKAVADIAKLPRGKLRVLSVAGAPGEVGELHVRGPNVMRGYYRAPEATAAAIDRDGWFNTGDLARFDGDVLFIVGRTKELIIRSGFNVYPAEVEAVLNGHPAVVQSAVIGRAVTGNEEVVAFVQLLPGSTVTPAGLMAHVTRQLAPYKRPCEIVVLDALPAGSTGKILKHRLFGVARGKAVQQA
jgi:acyl-CoA synthetase (AMP-forming)/AMP-acid ligase II